MTLPDIRDRIAAATGADREIDRDAHAAFDGWDKVWNDELEFFQLWKDGKWIALGSIPAYTASIDAALALAERMMPDLMWRLQSEPDGGDGYVCYLIPGSGDGGKGEGDTPPLAMLAALLTTLISESENAR